MLCTANRTEPRSERRAQETHTSLLVHTNDVYATRLCTYNVYATYTSLLHHRCETFALTLQQGISEQEMPSFSTRLI